MSESTCGQNAVFSFKLYNLDICIWRDMPLKYFITLLSVINYPTITTRSNSNGSGPTQPKHQYSFMAETPTFHLFNQQMVKTLNSDSSPLTGGVCVWAANDNPSYLQDVCDGGSGSQPALQVYWRPWAINTLGQPWWKTDRQHIQNRLLWERLTGHSQGLSQGSGHEFRLCK